MLKKFDQHAHCLYHMDTIGHNTENFCQLKHKIKDLIDAEVITVDSSNRRYEVSDQFKVHHVNPFNLLRYSRDSPFVIKQPGPCGEGPQNEYLYKPEKPE